MRDADSKHCAACSAFGGPIEGFCELASSILGPTPPPACHSDLIVEGAGRGGGREGLLMGTDRTWKRNKARQKRNGGELDLMMRVLSAPLLNGFSPAVCVCVCEGDGWRRG